MSIFAAGDAEEGAVMVDVDALFCVVKRMETASNQCKNTMMSCAMRRMGTDEENMDNIDNDNVS